MAVLSLTLPSSDTLLNVFLAIAVDNLANAQELTKVQLVGECFPGKVTTCLWQIRTVLGMRDGNRVRAFALATPRQGEGASPPVKQTVPSQVDSRAEEVGEGKAPGQQETDGKLHQVPR